MNVNSALLKEQAYRALAVWGQCEQLRTEDTPSEVRKERIASQVRQQFTPVFSKRAKAGSQPINAAEESRVRAIVSKAIKEGCAQAPISAGMRLYPSVPSVHRLIDDPEEAAFVYLTVARKLARLSMPYQRMAAWVYIEGRKVESCFQAGPTEAARRQVHSRLRRAIESALGGSRFDQIEETVSQKVARDVMARLDRRVSA